MEINIPNSQHVLTPPEIVESNLPAPGEEDRTAETKLNSSKYRLPESSFEAHEPT